MHNKIAFLQKTVLTLCIAIVGTFPKIVAQQTLADAKASILTVRELYFSKINQDIDAVTDFNGYPEFWAIDQMDTYTQALRISRYHQGQLYTELYIVKNKKPIYAIEEIKAMRFNNYTQSVWRCEYFIKDDKVIDYISLGHGKTEDDAWEPGSILNQFDKRKDELEKIRKLDSATIKILGFVDCLL